MTMRSTWPSRVLTGLLLAAVAAAPLLPAASADHLTSNPVRIDAMAVSVVIDHHYAVTTVAETLTNPSDEASELVATVAAPELSFVTRFALEVGGSTYESRIEDASAARDAYDASAAALQPAAIIESRDTNTYEVSLNIPAKTTVTVHLSYEELIARTNGEYTYRFPLAASSGGKSVGLLSLSGSVSGAAEIATATSSQGFVDRPAPTAFTAFSRSSYEVPTSDFVLVWTESQPSGAGSLIAHATPSGGTFVHVFSADGAGLSAAPLPKDIVFVIDVSGSMSDSLPQVKEVFSSIIGDLRPNDRFSVVAFAGSSWQWSWSLETATTENVASARAWVGRLSAQSATDIDLGLSQGVAMLPRDAARAPALILLSDGEPTSGETRAIKIRENLQSRNAANAAVYTLAFGPDADFPLMQALALENDGEVRRIWLGKDAGPQIRGFYDGVGTPLLRGVSVEYGEGVADASPTEFARAYAGSDLVTVGRLAQGATEVTVTVTAQGASGPLSYTATFSVKTAEAGAFVERAWAFERIRGLEGQAALGDAPARAQIVDLALAYKFVTDYTSLVVVLPPSLDHRTASAPIPMLITTSPVRAPAAPAPSGAYSASPPGRPAPGPDALLAAAALVACAALVAHRRKGRL